MEGHESREGRECNLIVYQCNRCHVYPATARRHYVIDCWTHCCLERTSDLFAGAIGIAMSHRKAAAR